MSPSLRTIDPGDGEALEERDEHEREAGAIPVHDLQNVDAALTDARQAQEELDEARHGGHDSLLVTQEVRELVDQSAQHGFKHAKLERDEDILYSKCPRCLPQYLWFLIFFQAVECNDITRCD